MIRAGLVGGKGVPVGVVGHPGLFVTLTAPSFGPVHSRRATHGGQPGLCRPRRSGGVCPHGVPVGCPARHAADDPLVGQPLCPACFDYAGAVLWQAHVGPLWARFTLAVRRKLAAVGGIPVRRLRDEALVSFARVAEYQRRGLVHVHAVVRVDGPAGPTDEPPGWATVEALTTAVREAHAAVRVRTPYSDATGEHLLSWGVQLDVRSIEADDQTGDTGISPSVASRRAVAAYVAKYATKSTEDAGGRAGRFWRSADVDAAPMTDHARRLALTCWTLGGLPEFRHLRLRAWAHALGFRGHCTSKSRVYSTTLGALRDERTAFQANEHGDAGGTETVRVSGWSYAGRGGWPDVVVPWSGGGVGR